MHRFSQVGVVAIMETCELLVSVGVLLICGGVLIEFVAFSLRAFFGSRIRSFLRVYGIGFLVFCLGVGLIIFTKLVWC